MPKGSSHRPSGPNQIVAWRVRRGAKLWTPPLRAPGPSVPVWQGCGHLVPPSATGTTSFQSTPPAGRPPRPLDGPFPAPGVGLPGDRKFRRPMSPTPNFPFSPHRKDSRRIARKGVFWSPGWGALDLGRARTRSNDIPIPVSAAHHAPRPRRPLSDRPLRARPRAWNRPANFPRKIFVVPYAFDTCHRFPDVIPGHGFFINEIAVKNRPPPWPPDRLRGHVPGAAYFFYGPSPLYSRPSARQFSAPPPGAPPLSAVMGRVGHHGCLARVCADPHIVGEHAPRPGVSDKGGLPSLPKGPRAPGVRLEVRWSGGLRMARFPVK